MQKSLFIPDQIYKRSAIHDEYGGSRQSGITPSAINPFIFIFTGSTGSQYGYKDGWDNPNIFSYSGEGQIGDMTFTKGNLALRDHVKNGKRVFLFEYTTKGLVRYITELEFFDVDYLETPDRNGNQRIGIKFFFKRKGAILAINKEQLNTPAIPVIPKLEGYIIPNATERVGLVNSRVGQGAYRKRILHRWNYHCAVTKFDKMEVLIASHIVGWKNSSNEERLDVHNGILLSPTYDALFDKHLISFENNGKIILSDSIEPSAYLKIGVTGSEKIEELSIYNHAYLEKHRGLIYQ